MRDIRKKVLIESGKKMSRKARARPDSDLASTSHSPTSSPDHSSRSSRKNTPGQSRTNSRQASRQASRLNSRPGSRYASDDEGDDDISSIDSRLAQLAATHTPSDDDNLDYDSDEDTDGDDFNEREDEHAIQRWNDMLQDCLTAWDDRKRSNKVGRVKTLAMYLNLVQSRYGGDDIEDHLPEIVEALLKSIRSTAEKEQMLALQALAVTTLSCPEVETDTILDATFEPVKKLCADPSTSEDCKAAAIRALGVIVLHGGGTDASASELTEFLMEIIETDGRSIDALDSAAVVTAALQMWSFVVPQTLAELYEQNVSDDEDDEDEVGNSRSNITNDKTRPDHIEGESNSGGAVIRQSASALDAFVDQLDSTDSNVQTAAATAIALLFEVSRLHEIATEKPLNLQSHSAEEMEQRMRMLARSSSKYVSRDNRRVVRKVFTNVATSLELGVGPDYATSGRPDENPHTGGGSGRGEVSDGITAFGYRTHLRVHNMSMVIDSWALKVRADMIRTLLGSGISKHLMSNPLVYGLLSASRMKERDNLGPRK